MEAVFVGRQLESYGFEKEMFHFRIHLQTPAIDDEKVKNKEKMFLHILRVYALLQSSPLPTVFPPTKLRYGPSLFWYCCTTLKIPILNNTLISVVTHFSMATSYRDL